MRILRVRHGFQADHSSSSYLFYAVDKPVSAAGQKVAHHFSSRADVDSRSVHYQKWGDYELSQEAYKALLGEHYDVMASESYDTWTVMIAVPKTAQMQALLKPFDDIDDGEFQRMSVYNFGKRLAVEVSFDLDEEAPLMDSDDIFEELVELLAKVRAEILQGDVSFLQAAADFHRAGMEDDEEDEEDEEAEEESGPAPSSSWSKAELQQECARRGISFPRGWTKPQLLEALKRPSPPARSRRTARPAASKKPVKLSRAARRIIDSMGHR